jgi:acyl dehydratase
MSVADLDSAIEAQITDEDIEKARRLVGADVAVKDRQFVTEASEDSIRNFAYSTGDDNPLYTEPEYGAKTRWGGQIAPNIMAAVMNRPLLGDSLPQELKALKRGLFRGVHLFVSGSEWNWYRPIRPGDRIYSFEGEDGVEVKPSEFAGRTVTKFLRTVKFTAEGEVVGVYRKRSILSERKAAKEKSKYGALEPARWTDEELRRIDDLYAAEARRGAEPRYFEDVEIGESMGEMAKGPLTVTDMIVFHSGGYGFVPYGLFSHRLAWKNRNRIPAFYIKNSFGVPDTAQRVHWDTELAQQTTGNPLPYDYGVMRETWLHHFLTNWSGDEAWVEHQYDEVRKFNYLGDVQIITGKVADKRIEDGRCIVDVELETRSQRDVVCTICRARVVLPSREHGPAQPPKPSDDLRRRVEQMLKRHEELLSAGASPPRSLIG